MEKQKDNSDHNDTKNDTRDAKSIKFLILKTRRKMVKTSSTIHFLEDCISNHIIPNTFIDKRQIKSNEDVYRQRWEDIKHKTNNELLKLSIESCKSTLERCKSELKDLYLRFNYLNL